MDKVKFWQDAYEGAVELGQRERAEIARLTAENARFREALEELGVTHTQCQRIYVGHPAPFTCIDKREHARNNPGNYTAAFRAQLLNNEDMCGYCSTANIAQAALRGADKGER